MKVPLKETSIRFVIQRLISFISEKFTDLLPNEQNVYRIRWDYHDKKLSIDFNRASYIQFGY